MNRKLAAYMAIGLTTSAGQADANLSVTFFGPGAQNPSSNPPTPDGISMGFAYGSYLFVDNTLSDDSLFAHWSGGYFTQGTDFTPLSGEDPGYYFGQGTFYEGAIAGDQNYANISFNTTLFETNNGITFEAVGQFYFDGAGGGYLVALAVNADNTDLSISAGKAAIDAIPEPTTTGLLALGAAGLAILRRRRLA